MSRALQAVLILLPLIAAGGLLLAGMRKGRKYRSMYLLALALLAAQALFWWYYAGTPDGGPEITWLVGLAEAGIALVTVVSARWGSRLLLGSAVVAPLAFLTYLTWQYEFGEGVSDGAGGQESFVGMAFVTLMFGLSLYALPAVLTWVAPTAPAPA